MSLEDLFNRDKIDKARLGIDNRRLTALLCAVLESQGGSVTLTEEQASRVWVDAELKFTNNGDGTYTVGLKQARVEESSVDSA